MLVPNRQVFSCNIRLTKPPILPRYNAFYLLFSLQMIEKVRELYDLKFISR